MVAGEMMDSLGTRKLFAVFSACSLATLVLYFGYVNILVHVRSWIKGRKSSVILRLNTSTSMSGDESESAQLLLNSDDSDKSEGEEVDDDTSS